MGPAGGAAGGAVLCGGGSGSVVSCTLATNSATLGNGPGSFSATRGGAGIYNLSGTVGLLNTIVAGNSGSANIWDAAGTFASQGFNLIGIINGSSGWTSLDLTGTSGGPLDPKLTPLANNG